MPCHARLYFFDTVFLRRLDEIEHLYHIYIYMQLNDVSRALRKSMGILSEELRAKLETDFDSHVLTLLGLLTEKKARGGDKKGGTKPKTSCMSVADDTLRVALSKTSERKALADLVASRVPADMEGMKSLLEDGNDDELQQAINYVRMCSSLGGRCSSTDDRIATFAPFAQHMKEVGNKVDLASETFEYEGETGIGAFVRVLQSAIVSIHSMILQGENQDLASSLTSWKSGVQNTPAHLHAALVCYDILGCLIRLQDMSSASLNEEGIENRVPSIRHMVHLVSPYASLGLVVSRAKESDSVATIEDLIMFLSSSKKGLSCGREGLKAPVYILYMNVARQVIALSHEKGFASLASSVEYEASNTMPPIAIQQWLKSQPPSAIIQVLLERCSQGLKEMSRYLVHSMKEKEMHALCSLSYSELIGGYQPEEHTELAMDDLLFYESTEGEFNLLPQQWDEDDDKDSEMSSVL